MKKCLLLFSMLLLLFEANAQERKISGRVTSAEDGSGLPGVNVLVQGTTVGTVTDIEGEYSLSVPSNASTLLFSSVGFTSQEVAIGNQNVINVSLAPDVRSLSEVVVTAFGLEREKKALT